MAKPHEVLGVSLDASPPEVRAAYKRLAMKHHPDRNGDPQEFLRVQAAYEALRAKSERGGLFDDIFSDIARELRDG